MISNDLLVKISISISAIVITTYYLFLKIRQIVPKREFCWFCNEPNEVLFSQRNSWSCLHCHQYNGFSKDGNYNKLISAQYDQTKNAKQYCRQIPNCYSNSNQLCNQCNVNQEIKVKLLAEFVPFNETNFSQECDEYKKHLEKEYKLCADCKNKVEHILSQPINSSKGPNKNRSTTKAFNGNDSVFMKQKAKRSLSWFMFAVINLLESVSLLCALVLLITSMNELQQTNELSLIEFDPRLIQFLSTYLTQPSLLIVIGYLASFIAIIVSGKDLLQLTNIFSQLLWIAYLVINIPLSVKFIPQSDSILLRPILCVFAIILSPINTCIRLFVVKRQSDKEATVLIEHKKTSNTLAHNSNVCSNKADKGRHNVDSTENNINSNTSPDQLIREQIEALCILDQSDKQRIGQSSRFDGNFSSSPIKRSLSYGSSCANKIILPAKFHYESIAQTSWVSPFKPCPTQSRYPRKDNLNYALFANNDQYSRCSHWINHNTTGLVTPPPSAPDSISSESALVNRYASVNSMKGSFPHIVDYERKSFYNSNGALRRTAFIGKYRTNSIGLSSEQTSVSGSLSTLTFGKTSNKCSSENPKHQTLSANLTQTFVFAIFLLLLFSFVIFLSLPVVFKTTCDFNSMNFHFTIQSLPQNNFCIK